MIEKYFFISNKILINRVLFMIVQVGTQTLSEVNGAEGEETFVVDCAPPSPEEVPETHPLEQQWWFLTPTTSMQKICRRVY